MNLLIVDDEPKIRRGLYNYFKGSHFEFENIETAENGCAALEKAKKNHPDIILADICMPKMDGLEFIEEILDKLKNTKIIIISGHEDFSYAQKAIRFGVEDYVLKPIDLQQLGSLIQKIYDKVTSEKLQTKYAEFALDTVRNNQSMLVRDWFMQIVNDRLNPDEIKNTARHLGIPIPDPAGLMIVRVMDKYPETAVEWEQDLLSYAVDNIFRELCADFENLLCFSDSKHNTVALFSYNNDVDYIDRQEKICETIERSIKHTVKSDMTVIVNTCVTLRDAYRQILHYLSSINEYSLVVTQAKNYIQQNYYKEDLNLKSVSEAVGASASYLSRLMYKQLGMSFVDYLTDLRMKKAAIYLNSCEKDIKLYEISQKLGYSSQHYFSRIFTKYYGKSPLQFRQKEGEKD